jgi:hypothetical protein
MPNNLKIGERYIFQSYEPIRLLRIEDQSLKFSRIGPFDGTSRNAVSMGIPLEYIAN